jgi:host cell factor
MLPGCLYRFRIAGINSFGQGPWSESSYSQGTLPGIPVTPNPPYKIASDLTWITLKWDPPNDSGSAIVGYR